MTKHVENLRNSLYGHAGDPSRASMGNLADFFLIGLSPIAAGSVTGTTGALTFGPFGSVTVARTGAGVYTLTLGSNVQSAGTVAIVTMGASGTYSYVDTSGTVKTVRTFAVDGTTATDKNFSFAIFTVETGIA